MKKITLDAAHAILSSCPAVIVEGDSCRPVIYPDISEPDDEQFPWITLSWEEDYNEFIVECDAEDNGDVRIEGNSMFLVDRSGEEVELKLLKEIENLEEIV